jgi:hypothetical protein
MSSRVLIFTAVTLSCHLTFAQKLTADSTLEARATSNLRSEYYKQHSTDALLFTGSDYAEYQPIGDEHPFLFDSDWISSSIHYNGSLYENIPLQYDIHSQKLLTEHAATGKKIELIPALVRWFDIKGHRFIYLDHHVSGNSQEGYFELLEDGAAKLLARHSRKFQESTVTGKLVVRIDEATKYYIFNDNTVKPVKGKSTALEALNDKQGMLQQEIKRRRLKFGKDLQSSLIEIVRIYNTASSE